MTAKNLCNPGFPEKAQMPVSGRIRETGGVAIDLPDVGTGIKRSSGTYIALLLQLEGEKWEQIDVLTDVMELLGISLADIEARRAELDADC